jgi:hypothetical protein
MGHAATRRESGGTKAFDIMYLYLALLYLHHTDSLGRKLLLVICMANECKVRVSFKRIHILFFTLFDA